MTQTQPDHKNMLIAQPTSLLQKMPTLIYCIFLVTRTPPPATSLSSEDYSITGDIHLLEVLLNTK